MALAEHNFFCHYTQKPETLHCKAKEEAFAEESLAMKEVKDDLKAVNANLRAVTATLETEKRKKEQFCQAMISILTDYMN